MIAVIGSLARGDEKHVRSLNGAGVIPFLLNCKIDFFLRKLKQKLLIGYFPFEGVCGSSNRQVVEFALRAVQQLFQNEAARTDLLFADSRLVPQLLSLMPLSVSNQISVTSIFTNACKVFHPLFFFFFIHLI